MAFSTPKFSAIVAEISEKCPTGITPLPFEGMGYKPRMGCIHAYGLYQRRLGHFRGLQ